MSELPLERLLPLRTLWVTVQFTGKAQFHNFHHPALSAYLRHLLGSPDHFENLLVSDAPESGRIHYDAGDTYRFSVSALAGGEHLLQQLIEALCQPPHFISTLNHNVPFRDNVQLVMLQDGLSEQIITSASELKPYGLAELMQEARFWQSQAQAIWHWLSPVRLLRDKSEREGIKGEQRYCQTIQQINESLLLDRVYDSLANLLRRRGEQAAPRGHTPQARFHSSYVFWTHAHYYDANGHINVMGGLLGQSRWVFTQPLSLFWWQSLVVGQYLGIGQRRSFGFGRYQWKTCDGKSTCKRASNSLL